MKQHYVVAGIVRVGQCPVLVRKSEHPARPAQKNNIKVSATVTSLWKAGSHLCDAPGHRPSLPLEAWRYGKLTRSRLFLLN